METVTYSQVAQLVKGLPETKLPVAYRLLAELAHDEADADTESPQLDFLRLPAEERRRVMAQQAAAMVEHYEETAEERREWQAGDFRDEC